MDRRWYELDDSSLGQEVERLVAGLDSIYGGRDAAETHFTAIYEGRRLSGTEAAAYLGSYERMIVDGEELVINLPRSMCDTVHAEIAGRQKPKPQFETSSADYRQRRRAKKLDKFCESQMRLAQGSYSSAHELLEDVWLDAEICGTGFAKVFADGDSIALERVRACQIRLDPAEAAAGAPRNWFYRGPIDRLTAIEMFCADEEEMGPRRYAIETAKPYDRDEITVGMTRIDPPILCIEAWHTKTEGSETPGRHVIVINGVVMVDEEWDRTSAPFVVMRWSRSRNSFWGKGLIEEIEPITAEYSRNVTKLRERFELCGAKRTYFEAGSLDPSQLQQNEAETFVEIEAGRQMPRETVPSPISSSEMDWLMYVERKAFEQPGISQMNASSRKEPGITAAVALRTMNDMASTRQVIKGRAYEQAYVQLGKLIVAAARDIASENPGFALPWPGSKFHGKIAWRDVDLDDDMYQIMVAPASSLPSEPGARRQQVQELFQAGVISPQTFKRLLDMPDIEDEMRSESAERDRIEWEIDRMLDAEEGSDFEFHPPDGYILDPQGAMLLIGGEYHQAVREGAPEFCLGLLRAYMRHLDVLIQRSMTPQQPASAGGQQASPLPLPPGSPAPQAAAPNLPIGMA